MFLNKIIKFVKSFGYAYEGVKNETIRGQNFRFMLCITIIIITCGLVCNIERVEWAVLFVIIGVVLSLELVNAAIEHTVDLCCKECNPTAKLAKDTAAAGVLIVSICSVLAGAVIFLSKQRTFILFKFWKNNIIFVIISLLAMIWFVFIDRKKFK